MLQDAEYVEKEKIVEVSKGLKKEGYRFAAMTGEIDEGMIELVYHFDLNYKVKNVKVKINSNDTIESISPVYKPAFLIENEIQDLYGVKFNNLIVDYKGRLYLTENSPKEPLNSIKEG